jgi:hypothetical protein
MIFLNDLIGKPFRYGAKGPDFYSCYGILMEVYKRFGIAIPEVDTGSMERGHDLLMEFVEHPVQSLDRIREAVDFPKEDLLPQVLKKDEWKFIADFAIANKIVLEHIRISPDWEITPTPGKSCMAVFYLYIPFLRGHFPHLGVFLDNRKFIHAAPPQVSVQRIDVPSWRQRLGSIHKYVGEIKL